MRFTTYSRKKSATLYKSIRRNFLAGSIAYYDYETLGNRLRSYYYSYRAGSLINQLVFALTEIDLSPSISLVTHFIPLKRPLRVRIGYRIINRVWFNRVAQRQIYFIGDVSYVLPFSLYILVKQFLSFSWFVFFSCVECWIEIFNARYFKLSHTKTEGKRVLLLFVKKKKRKKENQLRKNLTAVAITQSFTVYDTNGCRKLHGSIRTVTQTRRAIGIQVRLLNRRSRDFVGCNLDRSTA